MGKISVSNHIIFMIRLAICFCTALAIILICIYTVKPKESSMYVIAPTENTTRTLYPNDVVSQSFISPFKQIDNIAIGLKRDASTLSPDDMYARITVSKDTAQILDIELPVSAFPEDELLTLSLDCGDCLGSKIEINIYNSSSTSSSFIITKLNS